MIKLTPPISSEEIGSLHIGTEVSISGIIVTGRDMAHKYMIENFYGTTKKDIEIYNSLKRYLSNGILYHCGPVVKKKSKEYEIVSAGPTTSIREEPYEDKVIELFNIRGILGKGGMGENTQKALVKYKAVYLSAIGGAGSLIAKSIKQVVDILKLDFGFPEAFWILRVENLKAVVTMDCYNNSLHKEIEEKSKKIFYNLIG